MMKTIKYHVMCEDLFTLPFDVFMSFLRIQLLYLDSTLGKYDERFGQA
jgi:hypothetical protein